MTNADIVDILEQTTKLLELHNDDPFKIRSYQSTAFNLDKLTEDITELPATELVKLPGIGKSMANKIREIIDTGHLNELDTLLSQTPEGVLDMFRIKGIGPKKIRTIWHELGIENLRDLQLACENGQIATLKGFGASTQEKILSSLEFLQSQSGKIRMDKADALAGVLRDAIAPQVDRVEISGQVRRKAQEVDTIQLLIGTSQLRATMNALNTIPFLHQHAAESSPFAWRGSMDGTEVAIELLLYPANQLDRQLFIHTAAEAHLKQAGQAGQTLLQAAMSGDDTTETAIYDRAGLPYIVPEMREDAFAFRWSAYHQADELVTWDDLRGTLHNHSTWSDGKHTLGQMADATRELGLSYFGIADHSQTAAYANGLKPQQVREQHADIDRLNEQYGPDFQILKGIESDILGDGSLDYETDTLALFDYVVASVHQNLNMAIDKATARLIKAIENPYTTILGHPTGRLLLARAGYPIDHKAVIDACAAHHVIIEINASPYRLDIDWRWIDYAMQQGVMLSINPDAHSTTGLLDMHYGIAIGRKGGLTRKMTFNALTLPEMKAWLADRKQRKGIELPANSR
ncbi:helix-hairpin-helix domain-containing protein [Arsenicibacter rosenii]|uniref:DNA polymerase/3'-5' exonuclease PolX n=1 Tax=Arsenicibacter rosenii TaxID=1750698 RepID=A0A1S2VGP7_9BACT|nr:helix-hairpin-helix domain-containing protein [Arsenicibacter rosenii]OIN57590.1 DNA polymerase/3'-5' exonuclease PolX [Arsenicibacter rosenii]